MALHSFGTTSASALSAVKYGPSSPVGVSPAPTGQLLPADLAAIAVAIVSDTQSGASLPLDIPGPRGVLTTGTTTTSSAVIGSLVSTGGGPLATIRAGMLALGVGIIPGTFVTIPPGWELR